MSIEKAIELIQKQFGKEAIIKMDQAGEEVEVIPTGSAALDEALGVGGYPKGRIVEIFGPESSGKTSLALHAIAEAQKQGGKCAFVDSEHSLSLSYAEKIGVNVDELWLSQPGTGEEALSIAETLVRSNDVAVVVVDSVAALTPKAEIEGEIGASHMGLQARLMSQAMRKLTGVISDSNCIVIFINQIRMKIGIVYGNPEVTSGGHALKFYCSVRLEIRKKDLIKQKINGVEEIVGHNVKIKVVKNKVAPPLKVAHTSIIFGEGIDRAGELLEKYKEEGKIEQAGAWFKYNGEQYQGRAAMREALKEELEVKKEPTDEV